MIKFFRQIRYQLMSENKTSKYLKYAIGEILLVVIGILIAIQVNNWNTSRIQQKKSISYLKEIKSNLQEDLTRLEFVHSFNKKKSATIDSVLYLLGRETNPINYTPRFVQFMPVLTSFEIFSPVNTAFENMVSSENIDLIDDQELRQALSIYYSTNYMDGTQERVKLMSRTFGDNIGPLILNQQLFKMVMNHESHIQDMSEVSIHKNEMVYSDLLTLHMNLVTHDDFLGRSEASVNSLIEKIESYLSQ